MVAAVRSPSPLRGPSLRGPSLRVLAVASAAVLATCVCVATSKAKKGGRRVDQSHGFWTIPASNLTLCSIPKGGSSMTRQIIAHAAGLIARTGAASVWQRHGFNGTDCFYPSGPSKDKALERAGLIRKTYSPDTTNVLIARDPYTRAVSQFYDQIHRGFLPPDHSRDAFLNYVQNYSRHSSDQHHVGHAAYYCPGWAGARFDHVIDLEDVRSYAHIARVVPALGALVETGWENCTNGEPRLYMPGSIATHKNKDGNAAEELCTKATLLAVCKQYADDYRMYRLHGHPYDCACTHNRSTVTP